MRRYMPALSTSIPVIAPLKTLALKEDLLFDVSVIIVNYNGKAFLADCLEALKGDTDSLKVESIVVDNGSVDGSIELLQDKLKPTTLILAGENLGFSRGNNVGMAIARGRYFLLLNSDCFIQPGLLKTLVERLEAKEEAAAIGPRLLNSDGSLQRSCHNFFSPMVVVLEQSLLWQWLKFIPGFKARFFLASDHARPAEVDWVSGACLLLKRSALEKIGGLDECFFFYIEEVDLSKY